MTPEQRGWLQGEVWTSDEDSAASDSAETEDSDSETSSQTAAEQSSTRQLASGRSSSQGCVTRSTAAVPPGRKRRRPEQPSSPPSIPGAGAQPLLEAVKRGRGRPRKSESQPPELAPKATPRKVQCTSNHPNYEPRVEGVPNDLYPELSQIKAQSCVGT